MSCKNDVAKKDIPRKTPSSDEELHSKDRSICSNYSKLNDRATSSSNIRITKSRKFSKSTTKKKSKSSIKSDESEELSNVSRSSSIVKFSRIAQKGKNIFKTKKVSSSEEKDFITSNDSDSTSEYEEPKRKNSSHQIRNKKMNNVKINPATKSVTNTNAKRKRKRVTSTILENQSSNINQKNKETIRFLRNSSLESNTSELESKITNKSLSPIDGTKKSKQVKRKWKNSDSSDISDNDQNFSDNSKANNSKYETTKIKTNNVINFFRRQSSRIYQQNSSEDDEHDEICSSSSMSPQALGNRLAMKKSLQQEPETINMGGEPDTINMGGEPDDDGSSALIAQNVFSPKAPLAPPANFEINAEDDENTNENIVLPNQECFNVSGQNHISPTVQQFPNPILKSFEESSLRKSFDSFLELQNQQIDNTNDMLCISTQRSQSFTVGQMYDNYICSTSNNTNSSLQKPYINSLKTNDHNTLHSHLNTFQSYYMQQQESCLNNDNHNIELQQSISLKTITEHNLDNISKFYFN